MIESGQLEIIGKELSDDKIQLLKGWNLVGYKSLTPKKPEDAFASVADVICVYTYDNPSAKWLRYSVNDLPYPNSLDMMKPDVAYWIYGK
ncbi:hypothetical protein FJZ33_12215 [Candidatus Poribacteria bacterium]|nr:hypothetical protein [Candidatus Poribacteria bacterium]